MDFLKYKNNGIGLSKISLELLEKHIFELCKEKGSVKIIEFGSGFSTKFLIDLKNYYNLDLEIDSFDDSSIYSYKKNINDTFVDVKIRKLLHCSKEDYEIMFSNKEYDHSRMKFYEEQPSYRQKNCFYDIQKDDLKDTYDLVILDGPNGNGRNFCYLWLKNRLVPGSMIFIDDIDHYDFEDKMNSIFNTELVHKHLDDDRINKWENGGRIGLFRVV